MVETLSEVPQLLRDSAEPPTPTHLNLKSDLDHPPGCLSEGFGGQELEKMRFPDLHTRWV